MDHIQLIARVGSGSGERTGRLADAHELALKVGLRQNDRLGVAQAPVESLGERDDLRVEMGEPVRELVASRCSHHLVLARLLEPALDNCPRRRAQRGRRERPEALREGGARDVAFGVGLAAPFEGGAVLIEDGDARRREERQISRLLVQRRRESTPSRNATARLLNCRRR